MNRIEKDSTTSVNQIIQKKIEDDSFQLLKQEYSPFNETPVELLFPSPFEEGSTDQIHIPEKKVFIIEKERWKPPFVCAVSQWSRKNRREIIFILRIRHVGIDIRDWSIMKTFADFKALRSKLKPFITGIIFFLIFF